MGTVAYKELISYLHANKPKTTKMKRKAGYMTVALCTGASLPFLFGNSVLNPEQQSVKSEVPYCVTSPTVPAKITFAGQEVDSSIVQECCRT